jgi:hypothetical protein
MLTHPWTYVYVAPRVTCHLRWQTRWHLLFGARRFGQWRLAGICNGEAIGRVTLREQDAQELEAAKIIEIRSRGFLMASKPQQPAAPFADDVSEFTFPSFLQQFGLPWLTNSHIVSHLLLGLICFHYSQLEVYEALWEFFWVIREHKQNSR